MRVRLGRLALVACCLGAAALPLYADDLPPEALVRRLLDAAPAVEAGRAGLAAGEARQRRLIAGPHEWSLSLEGMRRRTDMPGSTPSDTTHDWAVGIERAWRLPGKAELDERLGAGQRALADAGAEESRHETARRLLAGWFAWLRGQAAWQEAEAERQLLENMHAAVLRRQELGDAARLEALQSEAALAQMDARVLMLATERDALAEALRQQFPGIVLPERAETGLPQPLEGTREDWVAALLEHEPALRLARLEAQRAALQAARTDKERIADPSIGIRAVRERDGEDRLIGLVLNIPIGGAARQADADLSVAEARIASAREAQLLREAQAAAHAAWQRAQAAYLGWRKAEASARQMDAAARLQARAQALGEASLAETLNARRLAFAAASEARQLALDALERRYRLLLDTHKLWAFAESGINEP